MMRYQNLSSVVPACVLLLILLLQACAPVVSPPPVSEHYPEEFQGHEEKGEASWYGPKFHGRPTASGEIYNMYDLTAAHKLLPLETWVQVTNLENQKKVKVRINDRGPFVQNRILDLSYAAARELDMIKPGVVPVHIKVLQTPSAKDSRPYFVQVGSFLSRENADKTLFSLKTNGNHEARLISKEIDGQTFWRVQAGPFLEIAKARTVLEELSRKYPASFMIAD